jgi:hypothetical protein
MPATARPLPGRGSSDRRNSSTAHFKVKINNGGFFTVLPPFLLLPLFEGSPAADASPHIEGGTVEVALSEEEEAEEEEDWECTSLNASRKA